MKSTLGIGKQSKKVHFFKYIFVLQKYFGLPKCLPHVKIKSKISYLGQQISIIHRQITEQLSFEIDVRMEYGAGMDGTSILFV